MKQIAPLHVISYNIHKGFTSLNKFVLNEMKQALRLVHADLVFLQEIIGENHNHRKTLEAWPLETQLEFLADSTWSHSAYGKNAIYASGHHGNAILSRYPFKFYENIDISTNRFERRGMLHGIVDAPQFQEPLHIICVHLDLFSHGRYKQIQTICKRIAEHVPGTAPLILAGDFNDWRHALTRILKEQLNLDEVFIDKHGSHARTFPSWFPLLCLDRIYYRGISLHSSMVLSSAPWSELSDHLAIYAEFKGSR